MGWSEFKGSSACGGILSNIESIELITNYVMYGANTRGYLDMKCFDDFLFLVYRMSFHYITRKQGTMYS